MAANNWGIFTDGRQAEQHLLGRYIVWTPPEGQPHIRYVCNAAGSMLGGDAKVHLQDVQMMGEDEEFAIDHPGFNRFQFDPLGWVNHEMGAMQAELLPIRQTHRGYGPENVQLWWFGDGLSLRPVEGVPLQEFLYSDGVKEMLRGEYPSLNDAVKAVFGRPNSSIAVSRLLALQSDEDGYTWLWRGASRIAMLADVETCKLGRRYDFLREELLDTNLFNDGVWLK